MLGFIEVSCRPAGLRGTRLGAGTTAASLGQRTICNHTRFRAFLPSALRLWSVCWVGQHSCLSGTISPQTSGQAGVPVLLEPGSRQSYLLLRRYKKSIAYEAGRRILTLGCELRRERAILMCAR